jgi:hypothetical protein
MAKRVLTILLLLSVVAIALTAKASASGDQLFGFSAWTGPPLDVRLYVPDDVAPDTPVVIVIHGWSRDVERYFDDWRVLGKQHGFIVVVPHFPVEDFPGSNEFNLGHVFDGATGELRPADTWTFAAIEPLFQDVVARIGGRQTDYTLFGHSAGSQFVHRFLYYMPAASVKRIIPANAGWYTLPDFDVAYPYGLGGAGVSEPQLVAALGKDVVLMLGREDIDRNDPDLRKTPEADQQGPNRFARGLTMFERAKTVAESLGTEFGWRLVIVDDAAHVNAQMAERAAELVD